MWICVGPARSRHQAKPGVASGCGEEARLVLLDFRATEIKLRRNQGPTAGGVDAELQVAASHPTTNANRPRSWSAPGRRGLGGARFGTLHRAPVGQGPRVLVGWPFPLGFGLDGRLLLARRGRVYV